MLQAFIPELSITNSNKSHSSNDHMNFSSPNTHHKILSELPCEDCEVKSEGKFEVIKPKGSPHKETTSGNKNVAGM